MGDAGATEAASGFIKSAWCSATSPLGRLIAAAARQTRKMDEWKGGKGGEIAAQSGGRSLAASRGHFDKALK